MADFRVCEAIQWLNIDEEEKKVNLIKDNFFFFSFFHSKNKNIFKQTLVCSFILGLGVFDLMSSQKTVKERLKKGLRPRHGQTP